jgi:hypothetical protein
MRHAKRVDGNHKEIRDGLRAAGFPVLDLSGCGQGVPDLAVKVGDGRSVLLEVKDGAKAPSAQKLTDAERIWFEFNGSISRVVNSLESALEAVREFVKP